MILDNIRVVLIGTTHPGNIGATARAMRTMGLRDLALVAPACDPDGEEATARAAGAEGVVAAARRCADVVEAVGDCRLVLGLTARRRTEGAEPCTLREAAELAAGESNLGKVAWLFGRERTGLTNLELDRCHRVVHIPTDPEFSSLNVAQAVQLAAWECRMAAVPVETVAEELPPADVDAMERFFTHLEAVCDTVGFLHKQNAELLMRRMRRLFHRARLSDDEVRMWRGLLSHIVDRRRWSRPS